MNPYLERFVEDKHLFEAVQEFVKEDIRSTHLSIPEDISDEVMGQNYKAYRTALSLVEKSFNNLAQFKRSESEQDNNRAI